MAPLTSIREVPLPASSHLVAQLLDAVQGDAEQGQHFVEPRDGALRLQRLELDGAARLRQVVHGEDQLVRLQVETHGQIAGQRRRQRFLTPESAVEKKKEPNKIKP